MTYPLQKYFFGLAKNSIGKWGVQTMLLGCAPSSVVNDYVVLGVGPKRSIGCDED